MGNKQTEVHVFHANVTPKMDLKTFQTETFKILDIQPIVVLQDQNSFIPKNYLPFQHFLQQILNLLQIISITEVDHNNGTADFIFEPVVFNRLFNAFPKLMLIHKQNCSVGAVDTGRQNLDFNYEMFNEQYKSQFINIIKRELPRSYSGYTKVMSAVMVVGNLIFQRKSCNDLHENTKSILPHLKLLNDIFNSNNYIVDKTTIPNKNFTTLEPIKSSLMRYAEIFEKNPLMHFYSRMNMNWPNSMKDHIKINNLKKKF